MRRFVSSKHLENVSDLTLIAPIKQGFISAFESVTYETRLQLLLKTLFKIRSTAREHSKIKPFVDTAERIRSLLDFRLAVLDTEPRQLMLCATFDRAFEPYMRLIWDPLGPLLDVIFCNCDGYVTASGNSFEDYLAWVRKSQIDSDFFYSASGHSIDDVQYLLRIERLQRERNGPSGTTVYVPDPEEEAARVRKTRPQESNFLGMEALVALYRLTDFYPPDDPQGDGALLRIATQQLLRGWGRNLNPAWAKRLIPEQYAWFSVGLEKPKEDRSDREAAHDAAKEAEQRKRIERLKFRPADIQGGILRNYGADPVRHGALLFMRIKDAEKARAFIGSLRICDGTHETPWPDPQTFLNLGFTWRGLENIGVSKAELERFPQEFREGMDERAGLLGDLRANHPRRWRTPVRNWPGAPPPSSPPTRIELSEVDLVLQLRTTRGVPGLDVVDIHEPQHPLREAVERIAKDAAASGVELVAVETMRRAFPDDRDSDTDHFGFRDGLSQPTPVDRRPVRIRDEVSRGELLWGYPNDRSDPPPRPSTILDNGTFLVLRKLRQHVGRLRETVRQAADEWGISEERLYGKMVGRRRDGTVMLPGPPTSNRFDFDTDRTGHHCPLQAHIRRANPRGRREGATRRPSPRLLRRGMSYGPPVVAGEDESGIDRGILFMAYNASIAEQYEVIQRWINAGNSTGIGSWLNDPLMGVAEGDPKYRFRFRYFPSQDGEDPDLEGVPPETKGRTARIWLTKPFVELQWGAYLFVPSMAAIAAIAKPSPLRIAEEKTKLLAQEVERGETIIARLLALAEDGPAGRRAAAAGWKACLEDFRAKDPGERADGPAVWAAIRARHGGAIRVPYGEVAAGKRPPEVVLVASKELVMRVFRNADQNYSMCGQMRRMRQSFGPIFLGLDGGPEYDAKAVINKPIMKIGMPAAFAVSYLAASKFLDHLLQVFAGMGFPPDPPNNVGVWGELDLRRDFVTRVLEVVCNLWFGIPCSLTRDEDEGHEIAADASAIEGCEPNHVDPGGWSFAEKRKPRCPGDFLATSRYCFYPDPVPRVQTYGKAQGRALRKAVHAHFEAVKAPNAPIAKMMAAEPVYDRDRDEFARTLIGVMTGFLPPTDASLRWTLHEWLEEKLFWRLQQDLLAVRPDAASLPQDSEFWPVLDAVRDALPTIKSSYATARAALLEPLMLAMQKRPSPDMLWRTAVREHALGDVTVRDGDRIFVGIVSAMAEDASAGVTDIYPVFGGNRAAADPPLHACPAYQFAMGTMMGILTALMEKLHVEALPAPLLVRVSARQPHAAAVPAVTAASFQAPTDPGEPDRGSAPQNGAHSRPKPAPRRKAGSPRPHGESVEPEPTK